LRPEVKVEVSGSRSASPTWRAGRRHARAFRHETARSRAREGVATATRGLEIIGVGYTRRSRARTGLGARLRERVKIAIPAGITVENPDPNKLTIKGATSRRSASSPRRSEDPPPEPYKGKGVKYTTETIKAKGRQAFGSADPLRSTLRREHCDGHRKEEPHSDMAAAQGSLRAEEDPQRDGSSACPCSAAFATLGAS
jgi:large subunit ribosomal protein L6